MARTKNDIVKRALQRLGVVRVGSSVDGNLSTYGNEALDDLLYEINEDIELDFDPTETSIPNERAASLANLLRYSPALDQFDTRSGPTERAVMFRAAKTRFLASVIGPSDFIEDPSRDF